MIRQRVIGLLLAATLLAAPLAAADSYKSYRGEYSITVFDDHPLYDSKRDKTLSIKLFIPEGDGPFPLVIISHGLGGSNDGHDKMGRYLATHGYVVINPEHADSGFFFTGAEENDEALGGQEAWENRVADVLLIIDEMKTLENSIAELTGKADLARIAVGGHSYGAYTTQLISGIELTDPATGEKFNYGDQRPEAFIYLSAQGIDEELWIDKDSWDAVDRPVIVMTGSNDDGRNGQLPRWRTQPYRKMPKGDKYLAWFKHAHHYTFSGKATTLRDPADDPSLQRELFGYIKSATIAFLDAYLKDDELALDYISSKQLKKDSGSLVRIKNK